MRAQRVYGELVGVLFLFLERVFHLSQIFPFVVAETVCQKEASEQVRVKVGRCHSSGAQSPAFELVVAHRGVHWAVE